VETRHRHRCVLLNNSPKEQRGQSMPSPLLPLSGHSGKRERRALQFKDPGAILCMCGKGKGLKATWVLRLMHSSCGLSSHISRTKANARGRLRETMCLGIMDSKVQCQVKGRQLFQDCFIHLKIKLAFTEI
jgi:hypothetical protein